MTEKTIYKTAIIGAGPAGLTTALQLKRYGLSVLLFEGNRVGGLLHNANLVENYPGFPGGIPGSELVRRFSGQIMQAGVDVTLGEVTRIEHDGQVFYLQTQRNTYQARIVVLAAGTKPVCFPRPLIPNEAQERICYEVYPLRDLQGRRLAIVGAGDAAFDYALNLARSNEVLILNRGNTIKCLPLLYDRSQAVQHIAYQSSTRVQKILRLPSGALKLEVAAPGGEATIEVDYLIGALGRIPRLELLSGMADMKDLEARGLLHLVGDVHRGMYRQTAIAVGDGMLAAMKIYQILKE
jgi:thioredoxin reductase (NADPH)